MTNLSPQAQAVLDAAFPAYDEENLYFLSGEQHTAKIVSAALRALVEKLGYDYYYHIDDGLMYNIDVCEVTAIINQLEAL